MDDLKVSAVCVCWLGGPRGARESARDLEADGESSGLEARLAAFRLCNVSAALGSDGRKLLLCSSQLICSIMSALCLITAHLQPGRRYTRPLAVGGGPEIRTYCINLYLDSGGEMQLLKRAFII